MNTIVGIFLSKKSLNYNQETKVMTRSQESIETEGLEAKQNLTEKVYGSEA